ncbi:hypothetical protein BGZ76_006382 [Entomortierella beljakovae]|nr:hypothetical protein BGZ76_006382 [Entomortierella beljakovae]
MKSLSLRSRRATSSGEDVSSSSSSNIWPSVTIACIALLSVSSLPNHVANAAPAKIKASQNIVTAMGEISMSATSALPIQLQIEARVAGNQKLAYLPTKGPGLDFYYLNYRPTYIAGESKIDFWMLTPQGSEPPKTASLELYDELGKIRLAVLVPEGTEIPRKLADQHEPFLWQSWSIPKNIKSDFDFSEKFRVVLKTNTNSDNKNIVKRADGSEAILVQDRQFKIKGLAATPGGKPHPSKIQVNSVAVVDSKKTATTTEMPNNNANSNIGNVDTAAAAKPASVNTTPESGNNKKVSSAGSSKLSSRAALPLLIVAASTFAALC